MRKGDGDVPGVFRQDARALPESHMLQVQAIEKYYGSRNNVTKALDRVSFDVEEGEFIAIVGPSGCGKSTLLSIIAGLLSPEEGTIVVNNPDGSLHYPKIGYMLQRDHLFEWRTVYRNVTLGLELNHKMTPERLEAVDRLLKDYGLDRFRDKRPDELSGGMKRKLMVCRALLTEPEILLLDEPTAGMDAISRRQMWNLLRQLNEQGLTLLLTTHYMEEAQALCHRVALMNGGRLNDVDTPANLIHKLGAYAVDEHRPDGVHSQYFSEREQAIAHLSALRGQCTLRDTTLEDVFVEQAGKRLS